MPAYHGDDPSTGPAQRRPGQLVRAGGAPRDHDADHDRAQRPVGGEERETREHAEGGEQRMAPHEGRLAWRGRHIRAFAVVSRCHAPQARHARGTRHGPTAFAVDQAAAGDTGSFVTAPSPNCGTTCCESPRELFGRTAGELTGGNRWRDRTDTAQALHGSFACSGVGWCSGGDSSHAGAFRICSAARPLGTTELTR